MELQEQHRRIEEWAQRQIASWANHPEAQKQVIATIPGQVELLKQLVSQGWELVAPSYPVIDWRAFSPSADAPKRIEVWKFSVDDLYAECQARAGEAPKCHPKACCEKAETINCVCAQAWRCPEHGEMHHGTHD
jgi:hypothetical protein